MNSLRERFVELKNNPSYTESLINSSVQNNNDPILAIESKNFSQLNVSASSIFCALP